MQKLAPSRTRRGSFLNPNNRFSKVAYDTEVTDGLDEAAEAQADTVFFRERPREVVNEVTSPDLPMPYSLNPYQGCEHGCVYCYARNSHPYWGFSSGLDFEQKIVVKDNAAATLEATLRRPNWRPAPIMLSGNTDCYQPAERQFQLTRQCLEVFLKYRHPVGIVTKNHLVTRDTDILGELAAHGLVHVFISLTTQDEELRRFMEPRTSTFAKRIEALRTLRDAGVPTGVMIAPVIPGLNHHEIPALVQAAAEAGAQAAAYGLVRLNGDLGLIFEDWLRANYPHRTDKVMNMIRECHGGQVNDSRFGVRMRGEGALADSLKQVFDLAKRRWMPGRKLPAYNCDAFIHTHRGQMHLF
jgi:DNA repair photolyase